MRERPPANAGLRARRNPHELVPDLAPAGLVYHPEITPVVDVLGPSATRGPGLAPADGDDDPFRDSGVAGVGGGDRDIGPDA